MKEPRPARHRQDPLGKRECLQEAVEEFVHEVRTPLTAIGAFAEILLRARPKDAAEQRQFLSIIRAEGLRLQGLVDALLRQARDEPDSARLPSGRVRVEALVERAAAAVQPLLLAGNMELYRSLEERLPPFPADGDKLLQVLVNLMSNAVKFSPAGARVLVEADVLHTDPFGNPGPFMHLTVRDQGCGIRAGDLERIFERHYSAWPCGSAAPPPGDGLGLAICRDIVEQHRGRIWAESIHGSGSAFHFTVPLLRPAVPRTAQAPRGREPPAHAQAASC